MSDIWVLSVATHYVPEFVAALSRTQADLQDDGIKMAFANAQTSLVARGRQSLWHTIRDTNAEKVIFIDGDISWASKDFYRLVRSSKDIISGSYLNINNKIVGEPLNDDKLILEEDLVEMAWCGFGFVALSKDVMDCLVEPFIKDGEYGEDIAFCKNARAAGFSVWLDPTIRVTHHKTMTLTPEKGAAWQ